MRIAMRRNVFRLLIAACAAFVLAGCASRNSKPDTMFDLGPAAPRAGRNSDAPLPALVVTDATGSAALDSERMFYRLDYADALQARAYANSRWSASPLEMVTQRLKTRLAQAGTKVLLATDATNGVPILRVEVENFRGMRWSTSRPSPARPRPAAPTPRAARARWPPAWTRWLTTSAPGSPG
jgi:cholesterol transport system auxiliary component